SNRLQKAGHHVILILLHVLLCNVWHKPRSTCRCVQWLVVAIDSHRKPMVDDPDSSRFVRQIGETVFSTRGGKNIPKVSVVHDHIDPSSITEVAWAFATRCHPGIGEMPLEHFEHNPLE